MPRRKSNPESPRAAPDDLRNLVSRMRALRMSVKMLRVKETGRMENVAREIESLERALEAYEKKRAAEDKKLDQIMTEMQTEFALLQTLYEALRRPPLSQATFVRFVRYDTIGKEKIPVIEIKTGDGSHAFVCLVAGDVSPEKLRYGQIMLTAGGGKAAVVEVREEFPLESIEATVKEMLGADRDGERILVSFGGHDESRVVHARAGVSAADLKAGDRVLVNAAASLLLEALPRKESTEHTLTKIPDVTFDDIGGLRDLKRKIREGLAWPLLHPEAWRTLGLSFPKGFVLEGGPGQGKTMIAKAVVNFMNDLLSKKLGRKVEGHFMHIDAPAYLDKWVGETERRMRLDFEMAHQLASADSPVVIFIDEADALLSTRGTTISSDVNKTHVTQFNALVDGLKELSYVVVILATNRRDLLDPAVIREGRFDRIFHVSAPDEEAAREILALYLKPVWGQINPKYNVAVYTPTDRNGNPRSDPKTNKTIHYRFDQDPAKAAGYLIGKAVARMYDRNNPANRLFRIKYEGERERTVYRYGDFASGARIKNIVDLAKLAAFGRHEADHENEPLGVVLADLYYAIEESFGRLRTPSSENEIYNWLAIQGKGVARRIEGGVEYFTPDATIGEDDEGL
ncbi:MAG: AAA family ATPase [Parcubacteria group bacterium]|nr:AAA family ATPase [Parcubacteria group bacterium]